MITKIHSYADSQGVPHASLEHAQKAEIRIALSKSKKGALNSTGEVDMVVNMILDVKDALIDILTTTPTSKVRARKINGATRTRKPTRHEAEQFALPMEDANDQLQKAIQCEPALGDSLKYGTHKANAKATVKIPLEDNPKDAA